MAKSALARAHGERLVRNWSRNHKASQCHYRLQELSFGKVFKQDPWDCGETQCSKCTSWKGEEQTKRRSSLRKDERAALRDIT